MSAPEAILKLVERFENNLDAYRSGQYNETQLRREFLDPFFKALGWDIDNTQGYAEAYKDVIHEDQIKIGGATKAPDYCFRIGQTRKFFLEAKKPAVSIGRDISPAYQLRRYAWSAKLPLSILSDFEEFAVYDCRIRPNKNDKASTGRILFLGYRDYPERWDEIASIFSREAILKGSFDKYAESSRRKRGTAEVDDDFLATIEGWRKNLAGNLALRNPELSQRPLNFAVQRIIDRVIFLRICEDRRIEDYGRLQALLNGDRVYPRLCELFEHADDRYNSGLFHFKKEKGRTEEPDELTLRLQVDDKLLKDIIRGLYYPDSPYEFSVLSADILGQVYEQFLGKVIRLTPGHRAVVEEKPEVKKAGGVYYTPTYIVEYIVQQTVGKLLDDIRDRLGRRRREESQTFSEQNEPPHVGAYNARQAAVILKRVSKLRVLDPACGSGSFLIGAYQYLLDWHLKFYLANNPEKWAKGKNPALHQNVRGEWKLTISERKRILLNNIYGVDIDSQAVEVTKLSLLLKVLEGETAQSLQQLMGFMRERALPDLGNNIKCGNSLIGPDFYDQPELPLLTDEERYRINTFDWRAEFPQIFRRSRGDETQIDSEGKVRDSSRRLLQGGGSGSSSELHDAPAAPLDYTMPGVPLHGAYATKKEKSEKVSPSSPAPMKREWEGGFDAVIGNPPYVRMEQFKELKNYLRSIYSCHDERSDLYAYFIERGHALLHQDGRFGMIVSNKFLRAKYGRPLRSFLQGNTQIERVTNFAGLPVFPGATVRTVVLVTRKASGQTIPILYTPPPNATHFSALFTGSKSVENIVLETSYEVSVPSLTKQVWSFGEPGVNDLLERTTKKCVPLGNFCENRICMGVKSGYTKAFLIDGKTRASILRKNPKAKEIIKPVLNGRDIRRYQINAVDIFLIYTYHGIDMSAYPAVLEHLRQFKQRLQSRATKQEWYELQQPQLNFAKFMDKPKIIFPDIATTPRFALDEVGYFGTNTTYFIAESDAYLLGLLNSKVANFYFVKTCAGLEGKNEIYLRFFGQYLEGFPVRTINFSNAADKDRHDRMVSLVKQMLELHRQRAAARTGHEQTVLDRQITATDAQIDRLVYDLYGLTDEEIQIVEGHPSKSRRRRREESQIKKRKPRDKRKI